MVYTNELKHYGILGMHWGVRKSELVALGNKVKRTTRNAVSNTETFVKKHQKEIAVGAGVAATAAVVYGGYKLFHDPKFMNRIAQTKWSKVASNETRYIKDLNANVAWLKSVRNSPLSLAEQRIINGAGRKAEALSRARVEVFSARGKSEAQALAAMRRAAASNPRLNALNNGWAVKKTVSTTSVPGTFSKMQTQFLKDMDKPYRP